MLRSLQGQTAWITGAGSGIGQAAAVALAREGVAVGLTGRGAEALEETARLVAEAGGRAVIAAGDVASSRDVQAAFDRVTAALGPCDILVNSAGVNTPKRSWSEIEPSGIDSVVDIDLKGPFYASRVVLPGMRARKAGLIIQVSSWAGVYVSRLTGPAYSAAKHGLVALSESINQEEGVHGVRSCALCPGEVATPLLDKRPVPVSDLDKSRMLQVEDLAEMVVFVARLPTTVCVNEMLVSPTWNRSYIGANGP